jgi:hypothetical protein
MRYAAKRRIILFLKVHALKVLVAVDIRNINTVKGIVSCDF